MDSEYILEPAGNNGELYHWGIKGMKWGIRRYQNKDGSLTAAGKKRYAEEEAKLKERERVVRNKERTKAKLAKLDAKKAELDARQAVLDADKQKPKKEKPQKEKKASKSGKPKSIKDMTDEELREYTQRMQLETQYHNAQKQLAAANPPQVSAGKKFINGLLNDVVVPAAKNVGKQWLEDALKKKVGLDKKEVSELKKLEDEAKKAEYEFKKAEWEKKSERLADDDDTNDSELTWDERQKKQNWLKGRIEELENQKALDEYERTGKIPEKSNSNQNNSSNKQDNSNKGSDSSKQSNSNKEAKSEAKSETKSEAKSETKSEAKSVQGGGVKGEKWETQPAQSSTKTTAEKQSQQSKPKDDGSYGSKSYEKKVNKILADMDNKGWEAYESSKQEAKVDSMLKDIDDSGWKLYEDGWTRYWD